MTLQDHLTHARIQLSRAGVSTPDLDAETLLRHALGWDRATLFARRHDPAPPWLAEAYAPLVRRRFDREPVHHILGGREFWGREFEVTRDVLVPRPETELIVEEALQLPGPRARDIVDVGTGSGCLAVTLAAELPESRVAAIDLSGPALKVAARNAQRHGVGARVACVEASFLRAIRPASVDLVVSNPPYVESGAAPALVPEVGRYEPALALFGGRDGLDALRELIASAPLCLRPGGWLVFEFGLGQDDAVRALASAERRLRLERIRADLQGIPRTAVVLNL